MSESLAPLDFKIPGSARLNALTGLDYYSRIRSIAISVFKWENLPETIPARFIEQTLFERGKAIFFKTKETGGLMVAKTTNSATLDKYDNPLSYNAFASPDFYEQVNAEDCVIIRNNYDSLATMNSVILFVGRLADVQRSIDVNIRAQKTPLFIVCSLKQLQTMKSLYSKYDGNEAIVYGNESLGETPISVLSPDVPYRADKLMIYKRQIWDECMTYLGINNANVDKKERLITDEVNANNQLIESYAAALLSAREESAAEINKKYGLNIKVKLRIEPKFQSLIDKGPGDNNG